MSGTPATILLATVREATLQRTLEASGHRVVVARDGQLLLEWARDILPDTIILDAALAGTAAVDTCRQLREEPRMYPVPIIVITDEEWTAEQRLAALRAGCWDC